MNTLSENFRNYIADKVKVKKECGFKDESYLLPEDLKHAIINICTTKDLVALFKDLSYEVVVNYDVLIEQFFSKNDYKNYIQIIIHSIYREYLDKFVDFYIKKDLSLLIDVFFLKEIAEKTNNKYHYDFCINFLKSYKESNYSTNNDIDTTLKTLLSCDILSDIINKRRIYDVKFDN